MVHKTRSIRRCKLCSSNSSWYLLTKIFWELAWKKKVSHLPISSLYTFFLGYRSYCVLRIPKPSLRGNLKLFFWELLLKSYVLLKNVFCFLHKSLLVPLHAVMVIIDSTTFWVRVPRLKVIGHPGFLQNSWRIWGSRSLTSCFFKIAPNIGLLVCYFFSNNLNWSFTVILIFFVSLFITSSLSCVSLFFK